jgi:hypothetical protein
MLGVGVLLLTGVLWVGWDGADYRVVQELAGAGALPNLARIGAVHRLEISGCATVTKPSWAEQSSGHPCHVTGVYGNGQGEYRTLPRGVTVWELARKAGRPVTAATGKCDLNARGRARSGNLCLAPEVSGAGLPFSHVALSFYRVVEGSGLEAQMGQACLEAIAAAGPDGFAFCHWSQPDHAGHQYGGDSAEYRAAIEAVDAALGPVLDAVPGWRVLLTSDHGFAQAEDLGMRRKPGGERLRTTLVHRRAPEAILASSVPLVVSRPMGRDVFKTLLRLLELPLPAGDARPEGQALVP